MIASASIFWKHATPSSGNGKFFWKMQAFNILLKMCFWIWITKLSRLADMSTNFVNRYWTIQSFGSRNSFKGELCRTIKSNGPQQFKLIINKFFINKCAQLKYSNMVAENISKNKKKIYSYYIFKEFRDDPYRLLWKEIN